MEKKMNQWFECKVRCEKTLEDGSVEKVIESYLVEALTYTEAEARFTAELLAMALGGEFEITDIKKARIRDLFESNDGNDDRWFRTKLAFVTLDETTGREKRAVQTFMVQAQDLRVAVKNIDNAMRGSMGDYVITNVSETSILDVFHYKAEEA